MTILELHTAFYRLDAIQQAATAFSRLAEITVEPGTIRHRVQFRPVEAADGDSLRLEFANWALVAGAGARLDTE